MENGLEADREKIKYLIMFPDFNAGQSHNIKLGNALFERM